jgi:photosystem II stability/assembly factor-like uncharacterized protein
MMEGKMRASMSKKSLISCIFFFLFLLLAGNASSEVEPIYAGWTVGQPWNGYGTILRSTDSGKTWIHQAAGQIANVYLEGVFAVDPYTAWVVGDPDSGYATIYHTTDGGSTWERKGSPDTASANYVPDVGLAKVHAVGGDVWAVGNPGVILHTSDGGATWTNHIPDEYNDVQLQGVYVLDSNTVWATGGPAKDNHALILKTTDAGRTWTRQSGGDVDDANHILGISAVDAYTAWAVGGPYIALKTINGGETWTREPSPSSGAPYDLNEVYAVDPDTAWVAADFGIYWTTDGGLSWDSSANYGLVGAVAFMGVSAVSAQKAWGVYVHEPDPGLIVYTTDGGAIWTIIDQLNDEDLPGLQNISFATLPINLDDMIISLIGDVEQLVDDGLLNKGQGNALIVKLERGLERLADDRLKPAINALDAFSNQVDAFVRGGVLPSEIGQELSDQVNNIIELL